ncbi:hypothetical protein M011DRAFT_458107 [Sporormia fimetaria CBS 119925]|uniref:Uncharacterized protein n=1 Tax=Sporormia fimetaria CBS 119925 TaxID=1340428 RepID=A0A6A6VEJ1_9PLEO|nr:hypothetical protein M011DRAFT_458107 [Sporormia fimetaria CBS 119925]
MPLPLLQAERGQKRQRRHPSPRPLLSSADSHPNDSSALSVTQIMNYAGSNYAGSPPREAAISPIRLEAGLNGKKGTNGTNTEYTVYRTKFPRIISPLRAEAGSNGTNGTNGTPEAKTEYAICSTGNPSIISPPLTGAIYDSEKFVIHSDVPWPGCVYTISDAETNCYVTLRRGELTMAAAPSNRDASICWEVFPQEPGSFYGLRNTCSGSFIGSLRSY